MHDHRGKEIMFSEGVKLIYVSDEANIMMCRNILSFASLAVVLRQITFLSFGCSRQSAVPMFHDLYALFSLKNSIIILPSCKLNHIASCEFVFIF
jgi:hypothetical protein